jgi:hypothetical protein
MKKLLLLSLLSACGGTYHVETTGKVTVEYKIDLMEDFFRKYCIDLYPDEQEAQDKCVVEEMAKFLKALESSK